MGTFLVFFFIYIFDPGLGHRHLLRLISSEELILATNFDHLIYRDEVYVSPDIVFISLFSEFTSMCLVDKMIKGGQRQFKRLSRFDKTNWYYKKW